MDITKFKLANKRVLVTGHTGFKGSWLGLVLHEIGAKLFGLSLVNNDPNSLYNSAEVRKIYKKEYFIDIRDKHRLRKAVSEVNPDYVFHLAAQPLVLMSVRKPVDTFSTNIIGTANLLEILLCMDNVKGILIVTSDKVYRFKQKQSAYREIDELGGGTDPYSVSKAAVELVTKSMSLTNNIFSIPITTARAGNVVGGLDWAANRLLPDLFRSIYANKPLEIRHPLATRPWQHVLDCTYGYILIAEQHLSMQEVKKFDSFNFGPKQSLSVLKVVDLFKECTDSKIEINFKDLGVDEQKELAIDSSKAEFELGWSPQFLPEDAVRNTIKFYNEAHLGSNVSQLASRDIKMYLDLN